MSILQTLKGLFSARGKAETLYKRGMQKAHHHDHAGAIADYTAVLDSSSAPDDVKAMARFNRALCYSAERDNELARKELEAVINSPAAPASVANAAREKLQRMQKMESRGARSSE